MAKEFCIRPLRHDAHGWQAANGSNDFGPVRHDFADALADLPPEAYHVRNGFYAAEDAWAVKRVLDYHPVARQAQVR